MDSLLSEGPGLVPVERARLEEVLSEQALSLRGLAGAAEAARTGSLLRADLLVCLRPTDGGVEVSVVRVDDARVLAEKELRRRVDVFLSAREITELVLVASGCGRALEGRLTVGIGPIVNESATGRLDKLGDELAVLLRERLREKPWAIVLERQYPTALLAEVGLVRAGLAEAESDRVPPADLVLVCRYREREQVFSPEAAVPFDLSVGLVIAGSTAGEIQFSLNNTSDGLGRCATAILERVDAERSRLAPDAAETTSPSMEIARLKKLALYLMSGWRVHAEPGVLTYGSFTPRRAREDARLAARAWENILLLGGDGPEAKLLLGVCLSNQYSYFVKRAHPRPGQLFADRQLVRASELIDAGFRAKPTKAGSYIFRSAAHYMFCRSDDRMFRYIAGHPEWFSDLTRLRAESRLASSSKDEFLARYRAALTGIHEEPHKVMELLSVAPRSFKSSPEELLRFLRSQTSSPDIGVRFFAEKMLAERLFRVRHPESVDHYARASSMYAEAVQALEGMRWPGCWVGRARTLFNEARQRCQFFGQEDRFCQMIQEVVYEFLDSPKQLHNISDCVAPLAGFYAREGRTEEGFALCEKLVHDYPLSTPMYDRPRVYELREVFAAQRRRVRLPAFEEVHRLGEHKGLYENVRMAMEGDTLWAVLLKGEYLGRAFACAKGEAAFRPVKGIGAAQVNCVAGARGRVCFGSFDMGVYVVDLRGKLVARLHKDRGDIPADRIENLCSDGEVVYLVFGDHRRSGVARLDPATLETTVLAPSSREATFQEEPVGGVKNVWWSPDQQALFVGDFYERRTCQFSRQPLVYAWRTGRWQAMGRSHEPRWFAVCDGRTLHATSGSSRKGKGLRMVTMKLHPDEKVFESDHPLLPFVRDAVWDATRLWLPTVAGLYEVDRASGAMRYVAHKDDTPIYTILKDGGWLYLGARDGIYRYRIP